MSDQPLSSWVNLQDMLALNPGEKERLQAAAKSWAQKPGEGNAGLYGQLSQQAYNDAANGQPQGIGSYSQFQQIQRNNREVERRSKLFVGDLGAVQSGLGQAFGGASTLDAAIYGNGGAGDPTARAGQQWKSSQLGRAAEFGANQAQGAQHWKMLQEQNARNQAGFDALPTYKRQESYYGDILHNPQLYTREQVDAARRQQEEAAAKQREQNYRRDPHYRSEITPSWR